MKAKEVLQLTGIRRETLSRLVKQGVIHAEKGSTGQYTYHDEDVLRYIGKSRSHLICLYARVSTPKQKPDLQNQVEKLEQFCAARGLVIDRVFKDIASGIDFDKRAGFFDLLDLILQYQVSSVVITYKDRLSRIGFGLFSHLFAQFGCQILVVSEAGNEKLDSEEIFEEIVSLLHCFSMRHYSSRRLKQLKEALYEESPEDETARPESD